MTAFSFGAYGVYIWPAYGVALLVIAALLVQSWAGLLSRRRALRALEAEHPGRRPLDSRK